MLDYDCRGCEADSDRREEFARRYVRPIEAYLGARWRNSPCLRDLDDAVQEAVAFHNPDTPAEVERECTELLDLLE